MIRVRAGLVIALVVVVAAAAAPPVAHGQATDARERVRRAIERYEAALGASDPAERRAGLEAALAELEEAQRLDPRPLLEWNLAQIELALGHVVRALEHTERVVRDVPTEHPRHAEAVALRAQLAQRVGALTVSSVPSGARVSVDGEARGHTPLEALRVPAGEVTLVVEADGHRTETRRVRIAGEGSASVVVTLERELGPNGTLRLESGLLDVQITIDGTVVGTTPLAEPVLLPAGPHELVAERRGYRTLRRTIEVTASLEMPVDLALEPDSSTPGGVLRLVLPPVPTRIAVDGSTPTVLVGELALPLGRHAVSLEVEERAPWQDTVSVEEGTVATLTPELRWQDPIFAGRHDLAEAQRVAGVATLLAGVGALIGGGASIGWALGVADVRVAQADTRIAECRTISCADLFQVREDRDYYAAYGPIALGVGAAVAVVGAAGLVIGTWLFLDAPSDDGIRRAAHARLSIGASGLAWEVSFR